MHRLMTSLVLVVMFCAPVQAAERRYPFEQIELSNGMKVISLEDFSCPVVAVQVWYHVGAKNEEPHRQGFAHMFEHMMFRGTDRLSETAHFDNIRRVGGNCNAYTSFDQTVYVEELPSNQLEMALWLESERMAFLKIDQKGFDTERKVVEEELRMGHNRPYGRVPEKLLAEIYGDQPYAWTPGGQIADLRKAPLDDISRFWDKYYLPNNATLVVVGAVKHADVQALAKKYFDWIPRGSNPKPVDVPPSHQKKSRTVTIPEDKGPLPVLGAIYRTVPDSHPDQLPLSILMGVIGGGESSRLYIDVVKDQKIAQLALAGAFAFESDGIAGAGGILLPLIGKKKELMQTIKKHIKKATDEPITQEELTKMKNQMRRDEVMGALTVEGKAGQLGQYAVLYGDAERINRRLDEIDAVTVEDVQRVAKKYLVDDKRISVMVEPNLAGAVGSLFKKDKNEDEGAPPPQLENRVAKRTGPKAGAKRPADFPATPPSAKMLDDMPQTPYAEKKLDNGLKVAVVTNNEVPMVTMVLGIKSGAWTEKLPGTAETTMSMLTKGTKTRDAKVLAKTLESNAISLGGSADMDTARLTASALLPQLDLAAELLADVLRNPTFPKEEFSILQNQERMGMMVSNKTPEYLADRELRRQLYGNHPYARDSSGELEDLGKVSIEALKEWWGEHLRPENCVLYFAGDIKPDAAYAVAQKYLGDWVNKTPFTEPTLAKVPEHSQTHIYLVDRPGSVQSQIRVGHTSITRRDPQYFVSRVLGNIFGGGFNSRLNKAIRVDKGLTYGARGGFDARRFGGEMKISTFTKTPTTAETVQVLLGEVEKLRSAPPEAGELNDTKTYITGSFPGARETPEAVVGDLWMIETQGLPNDYLKKLLSGVRGTTASDVLEAAKSLVEPAKMTIVVVGEAKKIKDDLEKIAPVTVVNAPSNGDEKAPPAENP
jgi:zinc protease